MFLTDISLAELRVEFELVNLGEVSHVGEPAVDGLVAELLGVLLADLHDAVLERLANGGVSTQPTGLRGEKNQIQYRISRFHSFVLFHKRCKKVYS